MNQSVMVVGLGLMGSALAKTLLKNDYPVAVWNRTSQKKEPLVALGARAMLSVAEGVNEAIPFFCACAIMTTALLC